MEYGYSYHEKCYEQTESNRGCCKCADGSTVHNGLSYITKSQTAGVWNPRRFLYVQTQVIFNRRFDFPLLDADIPLCNGCAAVL